MQVKFGLCCLFHEENIKYKTYTKSGLQKLSLSEQKDKVLSVIIHNINSLQYSLNYCHLNSIDSFRISSDLFPHYDYIKTILTNNDFDYLFNKLNNLKTYNLTLSMHPGQHVNLGSPTPEVVESSKKDLEMHWEIFKNIPTKTREINIHLGGSYGDKTSAKKRFIEVAKTLDFYKNLTIENDELSYSVEDCLEVSRELGIPVTFDLHHHRCHSLNPDYVSEFDSISDIVTACSKTWRDSGYSHVRTHISSPKNGYSTASKSRPHSDKIEISDFIILNSVNLENLDLHVDIEAKHKEVAIFDLRNQLRLING